MPEPVIIPPAGETPSAVAPATPAPAAPATPAPAAASTPAPAVAPASDEGTLLGGDPEASPAAPAVKEPTPEEKVAAEAKVAEDKKLLEADDKTLTPEQLTKKQELVKAAEAAKLDVVPETYALPKMPEGLQVNQELVDTLTPVLQKHKITQAVFNELTEAYAPIIAKQTQEAVKAQAENSMKVFNQIKKDWKDATTKMLGADSAKEVAFASKALNKFGDKDVRTMMNETGVGNHPALVKMLIAIGKQISEDPMPKGSTGVNSSEGGQLDPAKFYTHPTSPKK